MLALACSDANGLLLDAAELVAAAGEPVSIWPGGDWSWAAIGIESERGGGEGGVPAAAAAVEAGGGAEAEAAAGGGLPGMALFTASWKGRKRGMSAYGNVC